MLLKLCYFLLLFSHCISITTSYESESSPELYFDGTLPRRFFDFDTPPAPSPNNSNTNPPPPPPIPSSPPPPAIPSSPPPPTIVPPPPPESIVPPPPPPTSGSPLPNNETSQSKGSSGGLNGGQKAGIVIGTLAGAGMLVFGFKIYKKRRSNIRRARFGSAARRPAL